MNEILAYIVAIQILADDLHYESKGPAFYSLHLLADRVKEGLNEDIDALKESFYLGELRAIPPKTDETYAEANALVYNIRQSIKIDGTISSDNVIGHRLKNALNLLTHKIEDLKNREENLMSGTVAILDGISQKMLIASGLLERTLTFA